jgi:hypothetical protein
MNFLHLIIYFNLLNKMKKCIFYSIFFFLGNYCIAQHYEYSYDAAGNRTQRVFVTPRPGPTPDNGQQSFNPVVADKYGINIFPNPTSNSFNISIYNLEDGDRARLILSDVQGKTIADKEQSMKMDKLDLTNYVAGVYYLKVFIKDEKAFYKILKVQ